MQKKMSATDKADFIRWLKSKVPADSYNYNEPESCLIAQYLKDRGHGDVLVGALVFSTSRLPFEWLPDQLDVVGFRYPRTFGAALERAEKLL